MIKWIFFVLCFGVCKYVCAQQPQPDPSCNLVTTYGNDGRAVKSTLSQRVDSTADDKTSIAILSSGSNNYISVTYTPKTANKTLQGELVVRFSDNSSLIFPVGQYTTLKTDKGEAYNCTYIILDKYISSLQNKVVANVVYKFSDGTFKSIDMKNFPTLIKNGIVCLAPVYF